jgi:uncharacterized protein (DUF58 family)
MAKEKILQKLNIATPSRSKKLNISTPRLVNTRLIGSFRSMVKGRGIEFEGYRAYIPGHDDARMIDWMASTRSDKTLVKDFKEERNINIMFVLDGSSSMIFSSGDKLKLEFAIEVLSAIAYNALAAGDRVGLAIYGDEMRKFVPPGMGKPQFYNIMRALENIDHYGGPTDPTTTLRYVLSRLDRNSIVFILSDFIDYPESSFGYLKMASLKFDTIGIMIRDPRDMKMPDKDVGNIVIQDPTTGEVLLFNPSKIRQDYERITETESVNMRDSFHRAKSTMLRLHTDEPYLPKLIAFFNDRMTAWR